VAKIVFLQKTKTRNNEETDTHGCHAGMWHDRNNGTETGRNQVRQAYTQLWDVLRAKPGG
jgi:hypothetical protein